MKSALIQCALAILLVAAATAQPGQDTPFGRQSGSAQQWVSVEQAPAVTIAPGKTASATLRFQVSQGNHVNSNKPGSELLIPTKLKLEPPAGISVGKFIYPAGKDLTFDFAPDEKLNVYTGSFDVTVQLRAAARVGAGSLPVRGELTYQACNDRSCFPPRHLPVEFDVKVSSAKQ